MYPSYQQECSVVLPSPIQYSMYRTFTTNNSFMSSNQYFMALFHTTESSTETLMVTPLLWWSWLCLKNSWIIQSCEYKNPLDLSSTNAHFCLVAFYITALCKSYLKRSLNTTVKLMEVFFRANCFLCCVK